jgi:hypothetical protein
MEENNIIIEETTIVKPKKDWKRMALYIAGGVGLVLTGFLLGKSKDGGQCIEGYEDDLDGDEFITDGPADE